MEAWGSDLATLIAVAIAEKLRKVLVEPDGSSIPMHMQGITFSSMIRI
jgi:hypothetical protein